MILPPRRVATVVANLLHQNESPFPLDDFTEHEARGARSNTIRAGRGYFPLRAEAHGLDQQLAWPQRAQ